MFKRDLIMAVRELLERHLSVADIASRLHEAIPIIQAIVDSLT